MMPANEAMEVDRDGCDCPPHVLRCVHFDGDGIALIDRRAMKDCCDLKRSFDINRVRVNHSSGGLAPFYLVAMRDLADCPSSGLQFTHFWVRNQPVFHCYSDEAAALAAFYAAEEALIRGDA